MQELKALIIVRHTYIHIYRYIYIYTQVKPSSPCPEAPPARAGGSEPSLSRRGRDHFLPAGAASDVDS